MPKNIMTIYQNPYGLKDQDVEHFASRVKALLVNSSNQILLCKTKGAFSLIGGHLEENETEQDCLKREVLEETGILVSQNYQPLFRLINFDNDYFATGKKAKSTITYFAVFTDEKIDAKKQNLDEEEKKDGFELLYVDVDDVERVLKADAGYKTKEGLYNEIIFATGELKKIKKPQELQQQERC